MELRFIGVSVFLFVTAFLLASACRASKHRYQANGNYDDDDDDLLRKAFDDFPCQNPGWPKGGKHKPCGKPAGFCNCTDSVADCSGHGEHLSFIPTLPSSITHLNFSHNRVTFVGDDFFEHVTQITHLDLSASGSGLDINMTSFFLLPNLTYLSLARNNVRVYLQVLLGLGELFSHAPVRHLDLSFFFGNYVNDSGLFKVFPKGDEYTGKLEIMCLAGNGYKEMFLTFFKNPFFEELTTLDFSNNLISSFSFNVSNVQLPKLTRLYLNGNSFNNFLPTCTDKLSKPAFPSLRKLFLHNSSVQSIHGQFNVCLPKLQLLDLGDHSMKRLKPDTFNKTYFPSLKKLNIGSSPCKASHIDKGAFNNPSLEELYIRGNRLDFSSDHVHSDSFTGCPNLTVLSLSKNDFNTVTDRKFRRLFRPLAGLTELSLKRCFIDHLNARMFSSLNNLRNLSLDWNEITAIPDKAFDGMEKLTNLSLSRNRISSVSEATFGSALRQRLTALDLSNNLFSCTCDLKWFQQWLTTDERFSGPYNCDNMPNLTVRDFPVAKHSICLLSLETLKTIIAIAVLILLALIVGTTLYRHRWHLRLVLYEVFRGREDRRRRLERLSQNFQYDLFVSYDSNDIGWVRAHLMPELEGRRGLKLCIHERDFIPGKHIVDNIADCVHNSKKVMMLFSSNFAKSPWCQFELALCLSHVMEQGDVLLVVMLHDVPSRHMTSAMMAVMKTTTYIEWEDELEARDSFWGRIQIALKEILPTSEWV